MNIRDTPVKIQNPRLGETQSLSVGDVIIFTKGDVKIELVIEEIVTQTADEFEAIMTDGTTKHQYRKDEYRGNLHTIGS